jgi:dTMP kinase
MAKKKGLLITFEGSEGSGKSTQIELTRRYLAQKGYLVLFLREPGGVGISEKIRGVLLDVGNTAMGDRCETLLYMAARAQLVDEAIAPALAAGRVVVCDRFLDSTIAYQGYGSGINIDFIKRVGHFATQGVKPDLTFFLDIDAQKGLSRIKREKDRIEHRAIAYHNRVRRGYRELARMDPRRIKLIQVNGDKAKIFSVVQKYIDTLLK